jgi:hypothetical protein
MKTDTPETDSAYIQRPNEGAWDFRVRQEKTMEKLERERDEAREELTAVTEQRDRLQKIIDEQCRVSSVCREYREQRDRLAEAMTRIKTIYENPEKRCIPSSSDMYYEAIQSLTPNEL